VLPGSAKVTIADLSKAKPFFTGNNQPATGSQVFTGRPGASYIVTVTERDLSGNLGTPTTKTIQVPYDDRAFTLHGSWSRIDSPRDFGGSHIVTASRSAAARIRAVGQLYSVVVLTGPTFGKLAVFHGTKKVKVIDLYSPSTKRQTIQFFGGTTTPLTLRTFIFRCTGKKNPFSTGRTVDLDGFAVLR
jgi:hypothetical protein